MLTQLLNKVLFWVSKHSRIWLRANYLFNTLSPTFCSQFFPWNKHTAVNTELLLLFWWCLSACCLPSWLIVNEHPWQMVLHASLLSSRGWGISREVWHSPGYYYYQMQPFVVESRSSLFAKKQPHGKKTDTCQALQMKTGNPDTGSERRVLRRMGFHLSAQFLCENAGFKHSQHNSVSQVHLRTC